jgi:hypothetical protein
MTTRRVLRTLLTGSVIGPAWLLLMAAPAGAATPTTPREAAGSGTTTVGVLADAWFSASSACTATPAGCLPAGPPATPYPAKTLQVGVLGGVEESRTYLSLNLTGLPGGTNLTGGTLRLPVGANTEGSVAPDTATLQACLVKAAFKDDVEGSTSAPPAIDCKQASSPAKYVAAAGSAPEMFTVDLTPFASAWTEGALAQGIALVPTDDTAPPSTWHVSLSAHDREVAAPMRISAQVTYASAAGDISAPFEDAVTPADTGAASFAAPPLAPTASVSVPDTSVPATTPVIAPQAAPVAPAQQFQPTAAITVGGFAYPAVFLLPILLAVAGGWLARALTRDLQPAAI